MTARMGSIKPSEMLRALQKAGFYVLRQKGSHLFMKHADARWITLPMHAQDLSRGTLQSIVRQSQIDPEKLIELL